jgi:hypothetical protein
MLQEGKGNKQVQHLASEVLEPLLQLPLSQQVLHLARPSQQVLEHQVSENYFFYQKLIYFLKTFSKMILELMATQITMSFMSFFFYVYIEVQHFFALTLVI